MRRVLIVESPGLEDITSEDRRGTLLAGQLKLLRIQSTLKPIHTAGLLENVLQAEAPASDVIHLTMHGNASGIGFTDRSLMEWSNLQVPILKHAREKLLVLDACQSSAFKPDASLAKFMSSFSKTGTWAPRCVLTMFGNVYFADSVLAWGLFYRRLSKELNGIPIAQCSAQKLRDVLETVRQADLPKICASYWDEQKGKYQDITPWLIASRKKK